MMRAKHLIDEINRDKVVMLQRLGAGLSVCDEPPWFGQITSIKSGVLGIELDDCANLLDHWWLHHATFSPSTIGESGVYVSKSWHHGSVEEDIRQNFKNGMPISFWLVKFNASRDKVNFFLNQ